MTSGSSITADIRLGVCTKVSSSRESCGTDVGAAQAHQACAFREDVAVAILHVRQDQQVP